MKRIFVKSCDNKNCCLKVAVFEDNGIRLHGLLSSLAPSVVVVEFGRYIELIFDIASI